MSDCEERPSEDERVIAWRREQLEKAGFSPTDADLLASAPHVDLRAALALLAKGCPPRTALDILL
jgi:hypothetical protein